MKLVPRFLSAALNLSASAGQGTSQRAVDRPGFEGEWGSASLLFLAVGSPHPPAASLDYDHGTHMQTKIFGEKGRDDFNINESLLLALQQPELL